MKKNIMKINTKQVIYGMKCTQYCKIHNTEHKRYSFKTLNKYNAYINDMHFTAGDIPPCTHAFLVL